jgi:uncharacterized protein (TIGR03083 family)
MAAAERGLDSQVPACPAWRVRDLVVHLGYIYRFVGEVVRTRARDREQEISPLRERHRAERTRHAEVITAAEPHVLRRWFEQCAADLERSLHDVDAGQPVWTWWEPDQRAGFWMRRMAHETAVHRWDAEAAQGDPRPIDQALARDGIDEALDVHLMERWRENRSTGSGESYRLSQTDGGGAWLIRFDRDGPRISRENAKAAVMIRGTASDLLLFLWQRIPADRMDIIGDASLIGRYFELVPPE